jgi:hypothetical protein
MALPNGAGGYLLGAGNRGETIMGAADAPQTATATATLSAAQLVGGMLYANPSTTAATYTLPAASTLDTALPNAEAGNTFDLAIVNVGTSSGTVALAMGSGTGFTDGGNATTSVAITSSAIYRFRKTGTAAYTVYRIA